MSPNRFPNLRSLWESFQESSLHTSPISLDLRSHKESSLCTHKLRDPALGPECPNESLHQLHPQASTNSCPQTDPQIWDLSETLFRNHLYTQDQSLWILDPTKSHLFAHTNSETRLLGPECPNESLPQLCPQASTNSCPQTDPPNLRSLWDSFQESSLHTRPISLDLRSHKESSLCTHKLRDQSLGPECPKDPYINFIHEPPQTQVPKRSPKSVISIRLFSGTLFAHKPQSPDLRSHKEISLFTHKLRQRETLVWSKANTLFYFNDLLKI
jgi:hypothetical protein